MKITILGCYGPYPHPLGGCSGYLIESGSTKLLLDLGNGSLRNYLRLYTVSDLSAVVLSHLHPDHCSDVFVLRYALEQNGLTIPLYAPKTPQSEFDRLNYKQAFRIHAEESGLQTKIGDLDLTFLRMQHAVESYAVKITANGKTFVYSGDTGMNDDINNFIRDCDLFLCEAALIHTSTDKKTFHLTVAQACKLAVDAHCKSTVLTHFYPTHTIEQYLEEMKEFTPFADIRLAEENISFTI